MENLAEKVAEKLRIVFDCKSNLALSKLLNVSNSTLQSWLQRNNFGQLFEALVELRKEKKDLPIETFFVDEENGNIITVNEICLRLYSVFGLQGRDKLAEKLGVDQETLEILQTTNAVSTMLKIVLKHCQDRY